MPKNCRVIVYIFQIVQCCIEFESRENIDKITAIQHLIKFYNPAFLKILEIIEWHRQTCSENNSMLEIVQNQFGAHLDTKFEFTIISKKPPVEAKMTPDQTHIQTEEFPVQRLQSFDSGYRAECY